MPVVWAHGSETWVAADSEPARLRRGDPDAFDALLNRYQNRLYRYLTRLTGNSTQAEDLFQQTWLKVIGGIHRYDERRPFEPWLFSIARNLAIDHLRRVSPESLDEPSDETGEPRIARLKAEGPGHLEQLLDRERRGVLERKIHELPAIYREVITLRFEEEMTFEEMAMVLRAPVSTVKSRVSRALSTLRKELGG
jgi:RNA polymerase sigma-70 factor (ECF subfamily)